MDVQMVNSNLRSLARSLHWSMGDLNASLGKNFFSLYHSSELTCEMLILWVQILQNTKGQYYSTFLFMHFSPPINLHPMRGETMSILFSVRNRFSINIKRMNHIPEIQLHYLNNHKMFIPIFHAFENDIVTSFYFKNLWLLEEKIYFIQ